MSITINTTINGKAVSAGADASTSLLEFLRDTLEYKGTKLCCNTGECGARSFTQADQFTSRSPPTLTPRSPPSKVGGRRQPPGAAGLSTPAAGGYAPGLHHVGESARPTKPTQTDIEAVRATSAGAPATPKS